MKPRQTAGLGAKLWKRPAEILVEQRLSLSPIEPVLEKCRPQDEAEGYALQFEVNQQLSDELRFHR